MLYILTLSWFGKDKLEKLHPTLMESLNGVDFKWLIKDNGSTDGSIEAINNWKNDNIVGIKYPHNRDNYAQGCNFLFKEAAPNDGDYILLLNNDIVFKDSDSIKNMLSIIEKDVGDTVGAVGAKLTFPDGRLQHCGVIFDKKYNLLPFHYRPREVDDADAKKNREFQAATGAVLLTKSVYYKNICDTNKSKMVGMDENFQWCFEDVSACLAIRGMGKRIIYCGNTNISHEESASLKKNPVNKLFMQHNVNHFLKTCKDKYTEDHYLYLKDKNYKLY